VMIHRAICGSMERFLGILLENYAGALPLWLAPVQVVLATIVSDADVYAQDVAARLRSAGLRVYVDDRNEKINYKVREHSLAKLPVILVVGKREMEEQSVNVRRFGSNRQQSVSLSDAVRELRLESIPPDLR
jgi:threonyl-tRNA synthetase